MVNDLYSEVKDKNVRISYTNKANATNFIDGIVIGGCVGTDRELFLKLDNGWLINTKYITSIQIKE